MASRFPFIRQLDAMDCGPSALRMVCAVHGRSYPQAHVRKLCDIARSGVNFAGLTQAAQALGFEALAVKLPFGRWKTEVPLPCIAHWNGDHFVVVHAVRDGTVSIADPAIGLREVTEEEFVRATDPAASDATDEATGLYLLLQPTDEFYSRPAATRESPWAGWREYLRHFRPHGRMVAWIFAVMVVGLAIELAFPFLAQAVVDRGIGSRDTNFLLLLLAAQVILSLSMTASDIIRSWLLLLVGSRVSIAMIAGFLGKMLRLPLAFFETRTPGDIIQRIGDHRRVRDFLMSSAFDIVFTLLTFIAFAVVLGWYSLPILLVFLLFSALSAGWTAAFLPRRRELDHERFSAGTRERDLLHELVEAMPEIKIHGLQAQRSAVWRALADQRQNLEERSHKLEQWQRIGVSVASNLRNVFISFLAASAVINEQMTLGMMVAIQSIAGQLDSPVRQFLDFCQAGQDARLSMERMREVETENDAGDDDAGRHRLDARAGRCLALRNVVFRYPGAGQPEVLAGVSLDIPIGKVTAIVGPSGGGKSTILKLLLGLHPPTAGDIELDGRSLAEWHAGDWRARCGVVMQDGYIFAASIAANVAPGETVPDSARLREALEFANLSTDIAALPRGVHTLVGADGTGLSGGQKQRLLLARAIYRQPSFLLLDEATSALDAENESAVIRRLREYARDRTVVVIAHRLSTVRHADQIAVLVRGRIVECGSHDALLQKRGAYHRLVAEQIF